MTGLSRDFGLLLLSYGASPELVAGQLIGNWIP